MKTRPAVFTSYDCSDKETLGKFRAEKNNEIIHNPNETYVLSACVYQYFIFHSFCLRAVKLIGNHSNKNNNNALLKTQNNKV